MPITHNPGLIVERQIARGQNGQRAGGESARRVDRDNVRMRHRTAHERAMRHAIEMNVVDEPGCTAQ